MKNGMIHPDFLNSIKEIGFCVIHRVSFEVLYCNDAFRELKERLWPQENSRSIYTSIAGRRLIDGVADKESFSMNYHDAYSGMELRVTFSKAVWVNGEEAYMLTIAVVSAGNDAVVWDRQLLEALVRVYPMITAVNLTRDTYSIMEYKNYLPKRSTVTGKYSDLHLHGLSKTHPDYQEIFAQKFSRENLLARFEAGENEEYLEALQLGPDMRYYWSSTHAIRLTNPYSSDVLQYILVRPIDEQKHLEEEIGRVRTAANRYRSAITMTFDHIYEVDAKNDCVYEIMLSGGNVGREKLSGTIEDLNRAMILDRMHPGHREKLGKDMPWMKVLPDENGNALKIYEDDWFLLQSSGEYRWERIQFIPSEDNPYEMLIFVKDIHEVKLREERQRGLLYEALASAEQANAAKRDFLSRMSHDMRTPMNAIVGLTTIARAKADDQEKVLDALDKIRTSSQHLLRLINEVLDMSRVESGKITLEEELFVISELLENVMASIRTQSREKNQTLVVDTQDMRHPRMVADRFRLEQIMLNLLSNAVKYTGQGGIIMVSLRDTVPTSEGVADLIVTVEDNGAGMTEEFVRRIFDPFEREITPETSQEQGTGLGMPIVKSIVERMNGTIHVDSKLGKGSCFTVSVPVRIPESSGEDRGADMRREEGVSEETVREKCRGKRFLLVDDNELNREIAQEILQMFGARVDLACDGQQAVDILMLSDAGKYDAVFMDIQMPVKDGYEATREIRASGRNDLKKLPVFAMTANAFQSDVQDALSAGMNAHIAKPLDVAALGRVLVKFLP